MDPLKAYLLTLPEYSAAKPAARLNFLYSSLGPRKTANPTGYSSALNWWRLLLVAATARGLLGDDKLVLVVDEDLREKIRWEGVGRPSSLGTIVSELFSGARIQPFESYLASSGSTSTSWFSVATTPVRWGLSLVRNQLFGEPELGEDAEEAEWKRRTGSWVVKELVEKAAAAVIPKLKERHLDSLSRLYTLKTFHEAVKSISLENVELSLRDCRVLAKHLSTLGLCTINGEAIKFTAPLSSSPSSIPPIITPSDLGILTLLATLSSLSSYIKSIELRIEEQQVLMKAYHAKKQLGLVKSHLVSRKRLEILLEQRVGARDKLNEVLFGIEKAKGDEETMEALALGTKTLRTLISAPTLSLNNIEATSTALSEALADAEDINVAIREANVALPSEQEDEVEEELKALIRESEETDKAEKEEEERKKLAEKRRADAEERKSLLEEKAIEAKQAEKCKLEEETTEGKLSSLNNLAVPGELPSSTSPTVDKQVEKHAAAELS